LSNYAEGGESSMPIEKRKNTYGKNRRKKK
jgi:hypothetical protein